MRFTNNGKADLTLPNGDTVRVGATISVKGDLADAILDHPVVAAWVEAGALDIADDAAEEADEPEAKPAKRGKAKADDDARINAAAKAAAEKDAADKAAAGGA
jgi:hypothetical protein